MSARHATVTIVADLQPFIDAMAAIGAQMMDALCGPRQLVLDDPALWWAETPTELLGPLRDIVLHEVWCAAGQPERSRGATFVRTGTHAITVPQVTTVTVPKISTTTIATPAVTITAPAITVTVPGITVPRLSRR